MTKQQTRICPVPTNLNTQLYIGTIIVSDERPAGVQLKSEAKLQTVIGLITKQADCRITLIANTCLQAHSACHSKLGMSFERAGALW